MIMALRGSFEIIFCVFFIACSACSSKEHLADTTKNDIKRDLLHMVEIDQIAAKPRQGVYKTFSNEKWDNFKDSVFSANQNKLKVYYKKYGFLGIDKVGKEGANHFWLLVQHCDKFPDFQKQVLRDMEKEVKKGNANGNNFAYLFDRVQVNANKKQRFGTQVTYEVKTTGKAYPKIGLLDSANVDQSRKEFGLEPLNEYLNKMTVMHYEMNKESYNKKGIYSPNLYP
jgi:hypothetical protein